MRIAYKKVVDAFAKLAPPKPVGSGTVTTANEDTPSFRRFGMDSLSPRPLAAVAPPAPPSADDVRPRNVVVGIDPLDVAEVSYMAQRIVERMEPGDRLEIEYGDDDALRVTVTTRTGPVC